MPGMLEAASPACRILPRHAHAVISYRQREDVRAIRAGARGFVWATRLRAIWRTLLIPSSPAAPAFRRHPGGARAQVAGPEWLGRMTPREREVLAAVARGISNKQIGRELGLAEVTVKLHLRAIFRKTGAHTRSEAAVLAIKAGVG